MKVGDTFIFKDEKYVISLDKSNKKSQAFEAWGCKTGKRLACFEIKGVTLNQEMIEIIERMTNSEISIST